jgi:hypothetical protein
MARAGKTIGALTVLAIALTATSAAASPINVLTISDPRGVDNRIRAYADAEGRLVLTAPEGLRDPDGPGPNCRLDDAKPEQTSAQQVSCAPGYIGAIVGDLGGGSDTFEADPALPVMIGAVIDGVHRPVSGGHGRDRLIGGFGSDLLSGGGGPDWMFGGAGEDLMLGERGADTLGGGSANDVLSAGGGPDKLAGGGGRDLCRGSGGIDRAKSCELARSIP